MEKFGRGTKYAYICTAAQISFKGMTRGTIHKKDVSRRLSL